MVTATVPDLMFGCWRRAWIEFADGTRDDTTSVTWLQTESLMVDVRIPADRAVRAGRTSLEECSDDELRALATSDASSGFTECSQAMPDEKGLRCATASWHTRGHGVNFQPVSAFPEPGLMTWNDDATVMIERAPSGAYVEEWRLVPGSRDLLAMTDKGDHAIYRAGPVVVFVRDRTIAIPRPARLAELLDEHAADRRMMEGLLGCEFSVAEQVDGQWNIMSSTLPWREGKVLDVDIS